MPGCLCYLKFKKKKLCLVQPYGRLIWHIVYPHRPCTEGLETIISMAKLIQSQARKRKQGFMLHVQQLRSLYFYSDYINIVFYTHTVSTWLFIHSSHTYCMNQAGYYRKNSTHTDQQVVVFGILMSYWGENDVTLTALQKWSAKFPKQ